MQGPSVLSRPPCHLPPVLGDGRGTGGSSESGDGRKTHLGGDHRTLPCFTREVEVTVVLEDAQFLTGPIRYRGSRSRSPRGVRCPGRTLSRWRAPVGCRSSCHSGRAGVEGPNVELGVRVDAHQLPSHRGVDEVPVGLQSVSEDLGHPSAPGESSCPASTPTPIRRKCGRGELGGGCGPRFLWTPSRHATDPDV